ncbi:hypothetical protein SFRURICE_000264 [Spodoptera frugiperda]|uniref:Osiris 9 n=2 Tax=Spodoptera TaxID=7106 RepID=A0A922MWN8_SPOEX|nr:uncharacterized protein LOC118270819 [Spodoptera frugiperda]KAF9819273.1 hypothetical protein SFRURICE_000264 [Spodoptera frugiperda]KAH9644665.1 hypothetical protein HF086_011834 [Spodoptera exigua]
MKVVVLLCAVAVAGALPMAKEDGAAERFLSALKDCLDTDTSLCLKEKAMRFTDKLAASSSLEVLDGVSFKNTGGSRSARSYEPLPDDPKARELKVEERIMENVVDFLDSHVLQLRMPKALEDDNTLDEEGRGKKKKKLKKLLPILALIKLKLAALIPLFLGIIAFAVFKAYLLGKIAFIAAAFGALKKLLESKKSSGWSEPAHEESHGWESSGGWGRSQDAQSLAYGAHVKQA